MHEARTVRVPSMLSLDDHRNVPPSESPQRDTSVPAVFPPALRRYPLPVDRRTVPTISHRLGNGYGELPPTLANGVGTKTAGRSQCGDGADGGDGSSVGGASASGGRPPPTRCGLVRKVCSLGTLSDGSDTPTSNYWMLMITPVVSSFSLALVIAAVAGPQWLLTEERIPNANYNGTTNYQLKDDGVYLTKFTKSSLWVLCSKLGTAHLLQNSEFQCSTIDYFPSEGYSPDPNDSTNAIPYTVTHSSPFFFASNGVLVVSYVLFLVAMCSPKHKIGYFLSGVLFIISGLLMLIGLIMYISILKAEIGSKLRPRSSLQAPLFTFRYGQSFLLYVFGFVITELSGILNVLIYTNLQQLEYHRAQTCPTYQSLSSHYYNMPSTMAKSSFGRSDYASYEHALPRYYFDKSDGCQLHRAKPARKDIARSMFELYTEPNAAAPVGEGTTANNVEDDVDISATVRHDVLSTGGRLTRSVSTCTDILMSDDNPRKAQRSDAICGIPKQYLSKELSKEKLFNEFCKKVGPRPKPKNIYYIEDDDSCGDSFRSVFVVEANEKANKCHRKRRNSMVDTRQRARSPMQHRQRIRSDNSLDQVHVLSPRYGSNHHLHQFDYRQTLPRNFLKHSYRSFIDEPIADESGGFPVALDRTHCSKRISASGLLEPMRLNSSFHNLPNAVDSSMWPKSIPHASNEYVASPTDYPQDCSVPKAPSPMHRSHGDLLYLRRPTILSPMVFAPVVPQVGRTLSPVFDLDKIEHERRKSHSQLFLSSPGQAHRLQRYDFVNGTAV